MYFKKPFLMPSLSAFFLTIMPLLTSSFVGAWLVEHEHWVSSLGIKELMVAMVLSIFACAAALIPPTLMAVVVGYFWGWAGFVPLLFINLMAISLVYQLARAIDQDFLKNYLMHYPKVKPILERFETAERQFVFFTKLSPILPFALTNLLFAFLRIRLSNVLIGGALGMIPRTALAVWVGIKTQQIREVIEGGAQQQAYNQAILLILTLLSIWGLTQFLVKKS